MSIKEVMKTILKSEIVSFDSQSVKNDINPTIKAVINNAVIPDAIRDPMRYPNTVFRDSEKLISNIR